MRTRIAIAMSLLMAVAVGFVPQTASAKGCGYENDATLERVDMEPADESGDVNVVALGTFNQYLVELGEGSHFVMTWGGLDIDLKVCQGNNIQDDCASENVAPLPDGCGIDGVEGNPGWGTSFEGAGTYKIQVRHCTNTACGYPADAPDLPYVIMWF